MMYEMQYGFDFPDDFDMHSVRERVAEIGARFDELPGLHHKAFLVADRTDVAAGRYTPFYVWRDLEGMMRFLSSASFEAVAAKYGRPSVAGWHGLVQMDGPAVAEGPRFAVQQVVDIGPSITLAQLEPIERAQAGVLATVPDVHSVSIGVDPDRWQLLRTTLWRSKPPASVAGRVFEVAYLARSRVREA
jgi:hypothetical protein